MKRNLSIEYINEQIAEHGGIKEYDDGYSYCPYCGYANKLGEEDYEETYENETECGSCQEIYLESIEITVTRYTVTQRLEDKTKAQQAADELGWIVKELE
ncbi:TPA: hypothetical protein ACIRIB_000630 [Streptococcus suis]